MGEELRAVSFMIGSVLMVTMAMALAVTWMIGD